MLFSLSGITQKEIIFYPESGVHLGLKKVVVKKPSNSKLFYTTNGEKPNQHSTSLKQPSINIKGNVAIRFLYLDTEGKQHYFSRTYIVDRKHDLPIISIITDQANLFDKDRGIYSKGCCADTVEPYKGANFWKDWEREVQISFITDENKQVIDQLAGIQMFGGFSLGMPQKSFGLYARKKYGNNRFEYPVFQDRPFKEYKNLVLRNAGSDMQGAHIRDAYASTLVKKTGLLVQSYRPVAVYINGNYWGKYNLREKINEHFIEQHYDYDTDSLIIMRHEKRAQHGSTKAYKEFWGDLPNLNLSEKEDLERVASNIDIDNYLLYNACETYTGNADAGGNIRYFKHVSDTAKWRWIFYDVDHSMNIFEKNEHLKNSVKHFTTENQRDWPHPNWSTLLIRKLLENDSIKNLYIQRFCDLLNTTFESNRASRVLDSLKSAVELESTFHKKRWNVTDYIYDFSFRKLDTFITKRPSILFDQIKERFNLDKTVKVSIKSAEGGKVKLNSLLLSNDFEGNYFSNVPIYIEAKPDFDYVFIGWKELKLNHKKLDTILNDRLELTPIFVNRPLSKHLNKVLINEINAEQDTNHNSDYIEIINTGTTPVDISGWLIGDGKHKFRIPPSTSLGGKAYLIIAQNNASFNKKNEIVNVLSGLTFGINKKGELITLYDNDSLIVDKVSTIGWEREKKNHNWSRVSSDCNNRFYNQWVMELPSPGKENLFCGDLQAANTKDELIKKTLLILGIIFGTLGIGLFLLILVKRY